MIHWKALACHLLSSPVMAAVPVATTGTGTGGAGFGDLAAERRFSF